MRMEKMRTPWFMTLALVLLSLPLAGAAGSAPAAAGGDKPQLGVYLEDLGPKARAESGYDGDGVLVAGIVEGSAAEKAGLKSGDVIVALDGKTVASAEELKDAILAVPPGKDVKLLVFSEGKARTLDVTMGQAEAEPLKESKEKNELLGDLGDLQNLYYKWMFVAPGERSFIGIGLMDLGSQLAEYFGVDHGILVTQVEKDSPAEQSGLKAGDVLTAWNGSDLKKATDLYEELSNSKPGEEAALSFVRRGQSMEVKITPEARKGKNALLFDSEGNWIPGQGGDRWSYRFLPVPPSSWEGAVLPDIKGLENLKGLDSLKELKELKGLKELKELDKLKELDGLKELRKQMDELRKEMEKMRQELKKQAPPDRDDREI